MKKILFLLVVTYILSSCDEKPVNNYTKTGLLLKDAYGNFYQIRPNDNDNQRKETYMLESIDSSQFNIIKK